MGSFRGLFLLLLGAALIAAIVVKADSQDCHTITTTVPHFGPSTTCITLPICSGTVTVIIGTPFPTECSSSASLTSKPHAPTTTHTEATKTTTPWTTTKTTGHTSSKTLSTPSATPTAAPPTGACLNISPLCALDRSAATGFNIDYYPNRLGGYSNPYSGVYSNYYIVDGLSPLASSLTNLTYFPVNAPGTGAVSYPNTSLVYGDDPNAYLSFPSNAGYTRETNAGITVDANNFTLIYSGLFRAPSTGSWQLCSTVDNEHDLYFGDGNAFACLTGRPAAAADPILKQIPVTAADYTARQCVAVELVEGAFYPIRSVMANWQGPSAFELLMVPPGADAASGGSHDFSGTAYPHDCGIFL